MIITCPHCSTRYRVAADAISATGRQVQCASCQEAWLATPTLPTAPDPLDDLAPSADETAFAADNDTLFSEADEAMLDAGFAANERAAPEPEPAEGEQEAPHDPHLAAARRQALAKRRRKIDKSMPMARFRRSSRWIATGLLAGLLVLTLGFRTELVRMFPELGALYSAVGLGTNIVGLEFSDVRTLKTTRDGIDVLMVTATVSNVTNRTVSVPPVVVSLMGANDSVIYQWSVSPAARSVGVAGEATLETQLTAPPAGIERVRMTFAYGQNRLESAARAAMVQ